MKGTNQFFPRQKIRIDAQKYFIKIQLSRINELEKSKSFKTTLNREKKILMRQKKIREKIFKTTIKS